jgi:Zn-dependent protease/CBS domain-containing protein
MSGRALPIARVAGIEVRIHISWIPILAIVTLGSALQLESLALGWPPPLNWLAGGLLAGFFLGSIVLHELAHGVVARWRGLPVGPITIVFVGGVTTLEAEAAARPADEATIALAGPIVSIAVGGLLWGVAVLVNDGTSALFLGTALIGSVNLLLGVLNLVPGLPLDGGRLLRAIIWQATGDVTRAGRLTAAIGRAIGWLSVGAGLIVSLLADALAGILLVVSGWVLIQGSRVMEGRAALEALVSGLRVSEVMERDVRSIGPNLTVDTFAAQILDDHLTTSVPVVSDSALLGLIGVSQLRRVARRKWADLRAVDVMTARISLPALAEGDDLWAGLELLRRTGLDGIPVMAGPAFLGILTRRAVVAAIQARAEDQPGTAA